MSYQKSKQTKKNIRERKTCIKCDKNRLIKFFEKPTSRICNTCKAKSRRVKKQSSKTKSKLKEELWQLVRQQILKRDKMTCQWCGKKITSTHDAHISHVKSKKLYPNLKFDPMNLKLLCYRCHIYRWHKDPDDAITWFKEKFPERWNYIMKHKEDVVQLTEKDLKKLIDNFSSK
jgi:5-methylcytosine-specific restriction endonuclease McrA